MSQHIVIIGNGIAGITCARHIRKASDTIRITVVGDESPYFFSRTALMYIYMGHMKFEHTKPYEDWFWSKNRIELIHDRASTFDFLKKEITFQKGGFLNYDTLVLATGSKPNYFGWPGQDLQGVQGLYHLQDLELMEKNTQGIQRAVIVGGGLIGIEMAEMLISRGINVTFLVREKQFWDNVLPHQEAVLISNHIRKHHVDLRLETQLEKIVGDSNGRVSAVETNNGEVIDCQFVGLTAGVSPNVDFLRNTGIEIDRGILTDEFLRSSQPDVYAIGDCVQLREPMPGRKAIEPVWYTGRIMGETLAATLTGKPTRYEPGHWFNSAKFFDIEYQTYGLVNPVLPKGQEDFYWEHPDGEKCMHFQFEEKTRKFTGVNTFGIRLRQERFEEWLSKGTRIDRVIQDLKSAHFDPEFYRRHYKSIESAFKNEYPEFYEIEEKKNPFPFLT